jgi:hypothetical protein
MALKPKFRDTATGCSHSFADRSALSTWTQQRKDTHFFPTTAGEEEGVEME